MQINDYTLSVLRRGQPFEEYRDDDARRWIAAPKGECFSLHFVNASSGRVLVSPFVDGLSAMDGKPESNRAIGYVVGPNAELEIPGWRIDGQSVARFKFTKFESSYAFLMKRVNRSVGQIRCRVFLELPPEDSGFTLGSRPASDPSVGVGFGSRVEHQTRTTSFERQDTRPEEVLTIYYDTPKALLRKGIMQWSAE